MIALDHIADGDWQAVERLRLALQSLVVDTGGQSIGVRFGTSTATWTAAATTPGVTIPHGLARSPIYAHASTRTSLLEYAVTSRDATNIVVTGFVTMNTAFTGSATFDWVVIG